MILWTIQHENAYKELIEKGSIHAEENRIVIDDFKDSYRWMVEQMKNRIGNPPDDVTFPMWAWYQWEGKRKRPDMRTHGYGWGDRGTPIVLMTMDVPDEQVLLSDFDYWHVVLNDGELIIPYIENAVYTKEEKRKSWENIFDITCPYDKDRTMGLSTQATMWEIRKEWLIKVEHFLSKYI